MKRSAKNKKIKPIKHRGNNWDRLLSPESVPQSVVHNEPNPDLTLIKWAGAIITIGLLVGALIAKQ